MAKKTQQSKQNDQNRLPMKNYVGYAMGDMAGVITFGTIGPSCRCSTRIFCIFHWGRSRS